MEEAKKGFFPMSHGIHLSKSQCPTTIDEWDRMSKVPYASAIGSIMYAMISTRPDVSYALSVTSRYQSDPGESHCTAVKNILKYLRRTKNVFLVYGGEEELVVTGYTDASFQTDKDDSKSQSGYMFTINGGAVSWKSSKQETVADSTTEVEYIVASEAAKEGVWIRKFLSLVCSLMPLARWISTVKIVELLRKPKSQGITKRANMLCGDFISFESSSIGMRSRYAKYTRT